MADLIQAYYDHAQLSDAAYAALSEEKGVSNCLVI
jgi:hypothetical protein